jgi:hypothetical protein
VAVATVDAREGSAALEAFERDGRADLEVTVHAVDAAGEKVFEGTFDYALRARRTS